VVENEEEDEIEKEDGAKNSSSTKNEEKEDDSGDDSGDDSVTADEVPSSTSTSATTESATKSPPAPATPGKDNIDITKTMLSTPPRSSTPTISTPTTAGTSARSISAMKVNTKFDVDEFTLRLFKVPFLVYRIKGKESKLRCIRINEACEVCFFKSFVENESAVRVTGAPYIKIPIKTLKACFPCEEGNGRFFILEFQSRTFQLASSTLLDANYLISGFSNLASRVKYDKVFLDLWEEKFTHGAYPITPKKPKSMKEKK
jgi:hypothetical protein